MDLALLVYAISLLSGISKFFIFLCALGTLTVVGNAIHYTDYCAGDTEPAKRSISRMWKGFWVAIVAAWVVILLPTEKTAYTMVGAYAAQKVSENDKVQEMSGKVLTIIEQKLDGIIEDGVKEAEEKLTKEPKRQRKL